MNESTTFALKVGLWGNGLAIAAAALIFRDPPGSAIRPMDIPLYLFLIAAGTAMFGLYPAISGAVKERWRIVSIGCVVLCASPLLLGLFAFAFLVEMFGYTLKP